MGLPYEVPPSGGHKTTGPAPLVVALDVPHRSHLVRLIVKQIGGNDAFKVDLYNNAQAAAGGNNQDADGNALPPDLYKITDQLSGTNGLLAFHPDIIAGSAGVPFFNLDPRNKDRQVGLQKLYVVITVPGAGAGVQKEFAVACGLQSDMT